MEAPSAEESKPVIIYQNERLRVVGCANRTGFTTLALERTTKRDAMGQVVWEEYLPACFFDQCDFTSRDCWVLLLNMSVEILKHMDGVSGKAHSCATKKEMAGQAQTN